MQTRRIRRTVRQTISRIAETKRVIHVQGPTQFNPFIASTADYMRLVPQLSVGTNDGFRIGTKVTPQYLTVRGYINRTPGVGSGTNNPIDVTIFILQDKQQRDGNQRTAASSVNIMRYDGTTIGQFDGTMRAMASPVDTTNFKVIKRKVIRLLPVDAVGAPGQVYIANGAIARTFKWKIPVKKLGAFRYTDGTAAEPENVNFFLTCGYVDAGNPTFPPSALQTPVQISYNSTLYFKDL